ncbi:orexin receptor type 2-like [Euwallacea fornicatus]|uniref:orexin receptor type 2-like n=1 Tax=Euwallacea fornicatus TaxID=995702 RepID=UPI00338F1498
MHFLTVYTFFSSILFLLPTTSGQFSEDTKLRQQRDTSSEDLLDIVHTPKKRFFIYKNGSSDQTKQDLYENFVVIQPWMYGLIACHGVVFIVGVFGNILVCVAVYRNPSMRTVTNYFIVNLAVADALVILFCLPFSVMWDVTSTWWFGTAMCKFVLHFQSVSVTVSILTLTYISIDRWYAFCYPLSFRTTTAKAQGAICIIWILSTVCQIPETYSLRTVPYQDFEIYLTQCVPAWGQKIDKIYFIVKTIIFFVLPLIFMSVAYTKIVMILWRSNNDQRPAGSNRSGENTFSMNMNTSTEGQLKSRRKAAKMLVSVVLVFALCLTPLHFMNIIKDSLDHTQVNRALFLLCHWLLYANSAVNPLIYNFMSGKFRREFKSAFYQCNLFNKSDRRFARNSTYIYRYTTNNRHSCKSKTEMVPLSAVKQP